MKRIAAAGLLALSSVLSCTLPALAGGSLWKCDLAPVNDKTAFFSGSLLILWDGARGEAWVSDPQITDISGDFVPVRLAVKDGVIGMRWKVRLAEHQGARTARFAYKAGFDATGKTITVTGWVDGWDYPPARTVSGPCAQL
ncbi:hypothetical protein [Pseudogemmobacter humi]|uniref:Uncharacterized protein n=1 Tax=Pseudogemmobacter humi TaxID=2483812 RepID=A0A3P5XGE8_9RHOB|nr:hypothetical protein [Pseudogemmobacter humi]VDC30563.1 hypothetical protein XINFAN_02589 [Pseudogemmobacter humi]